MGNACSTSGASAVVRERHKSNSSDIVSNSPNKDEGGSRNFDKKLVFQDTQDDEGPYYTKPVMEDSEFPVRTTRRRSNTVSEESNADGGNNLDKKPALPTVFKWDGGGKQVYISGTFSNWKALPMVKSHGDFVTIIDLPEGEHEYKFCVDGEWTHDPKSTNTPSDTGTKCNVVSVRQSDFEVFQALAKDSEQSVDLAQKEYSQDIPQIKPWEKISGPPILPPHLLQVILNKDTPLSCEPTLLPEPNHVMLNHLYALSIKDGVMVLSATHRYRKKYVTTLLYKPI